MSDNPIDKKLYGKDFFGNSVNYNKPTGPVAERFLIPPFTILDTKTGYWQKRKKAWLRVGIRGEIGRDAEANPCNGPDSKYSYMPTFDTGVSVFDPVLCELAYRWFCPGNGQIVDPFAGGSVRGIVASLLGFRYWGCDLRQEQIDENIKQCNEICDRKKPDYICGDSLETVGSAPNADFIFSCPPYGNLEKYSDMEEDISNMSHSEFVNIYNQIIAKSINKLKNNRFACFVVGDFRDKKGFYRNFVSDTINAFEQGGAKLYNEAILLTAVGSASMRVTKQFNSGRKLCKIHQNILVFFKGDDPKKTTNLIKKRG